MNSTLVIITLVVMTVFSNVASSKFAEVTCLEWCDIDKLTCIEEHVAPKKGFFQNMVQRWGCSVKRFACQIQCYKRSRKEADGDIESA
ncbi:hypothetical protein LSAT2_018577 [Lamellibrachia satsuma]|nr:hypothetical protein LSAT2_018577 [Lamellibrachia satsuma]